MKPDPAVNRLKLAYRQGISDGMENRSSPPTWLLNNPQESLWITAYQNGFREGLKVYRAGMAGGVK